MMYLFARLMQAIDPVERAYWHRIARILGELKPVDTRRFMYGRD